MLETLKNWMVNQGATLASKVLFAVIITVAGILIVRIVMNLIRRLLEKSKLEKAAHSLITALAKTVMYLLLGLIVASSLGIDVTGIVALASVATLAVSLALQNMLANVIGGFTLLYTHPFGAGDFVQIAGESGTVREVGIAYTKLCTPDNKLISIPNSSVVATDIVNFSCEPTRRVDITVSASYDAPIEQVEAALAEVAAIPGVLSDPAPFISVSGYGDHAINYEVRVWVNSPDYWDVHFALQHKVKELFDEKGIAMTYPHLNVHLDK